MHAVRSDSKANVDVVVNDQRRAGFPADPGHALRLSNLVADRPFLLAKLDGVCAAAYGEFCESIGAETLLVVEVGDGVKPSYAMSSGFNHEGGLFPQMLCTLCVKIFFCFPTHKLVMSKTQTNQSRRSFLKQGALAGAGIAVAPQLGRAWSPGLTPPAHPIAVSSANGLEAVKKAVEIMKQGGDPLSAVVAGVNIVEADPNDISVGYGGVPNFDGVVELDSACMHGPTGRSGAVGAIQGIMHPSNVAKLVLERTDHCLIVGEGAQKFALMHGFKVENLLTDRAREIWMDWREKLSTQDDYLPPLAPDQLDIGLEAFEEERHYGTIHCSGVNTYGDISSVTTTCGLFFKIPGRVGDSPIVGAGLYTDNEVGSAGSTGRGEANIENLCSFLIVERMRMGDSPEDACLFACERIASHTILRRLQEADGKPNFNVRFYAVNKAGVFGGAELRNNNGKMSVCDADGARHVPLAHLYDD
jgi:N4-(beta-N-acetylglucosaminyl)-L-asparaginase